MQLQEIPLDANDLLQRVARIDPSLYNRIIAEAQRDALLGMVNAVTGAKEDQKGQELESPSEDELDSEAEEIDLDG